MLYGLDALASVIINCYPQLNCPNSSLNQSRSSALILTPVFVISQNGMDLATSEPHLEIQQVFTFNTGLVTPPPSSTTSPATKSLMRVQAHLAAFLRGVAPYVLYSGGFHFHADDMVAYMHRLIGSDQLHWINGQRQVERCTVTSQINIIEINMRCVVQWAEGARTICT
jgi:hypothetical protein